MKKNLKSIIRASSSALCLCLLIAVLGVGASLADTPTHTHDSTDFAEWTATENLPTASGSYYLASDITATENITIPEGAEITLCLNGKTVTMDSYYIANNGTLTICDCQETQGSIASAQNNYNAGTITNSGTGSVTVLGGTVSGSSTSRYAIRNTGTGSVTVSGGTLNAYHGIYNASSGSVTVTGGTITANSEKGYGIYTYKDSTGSVTVSGGTISGYRGIYYVGTGTVTVSGGEISGEYGIAAYSSAETYLFGAPKITGTTASIYIATDSASIYASDGDSAYEGETLTVELDSSLEIGRVVISAASESKDKFAVINEGYYLEYSNGDLVLALHTHEWSTDYTVDATAHWHECTAEGCNITENSEKDGYAAHTEGICAECGMLGINEANFPDENFRAYISDNCDINGDGFLSQEELDRVSAIYVEEKNISSLQGIEYFTSIEGLDCYGNLLTRLDLSQNTELVILNCYNNDLTELSISTLTKLETLHCQYNNITSIDVSNSIKLCDLICYGNALSELDVSNNIALERLYCYENMLTHIDLSANTSLEDFAGSSQYITVSYNSNKQYTMPEGFNGANVTYTEGGSFDGNVLTVDTEWSSEYANNTQLCYDYNAGNDKTIRVYAHVHSECGICSLCGLAINEANFPDATFRTYVSENIDADKDGLLSSTEISEVLEINVEQSNITDLTGIKYFTALECLWAGGNSFTTLDLSRLPELYYLNVLGNDDLTSLDITDCTKLEHLDISSCMNLESIDLTTNTELQYLNIDGIWWSSIDLSQNTKLGQLLINDTGFTTLDLSNNPEIYRLEGCSMIPTKHCAVGYVNLNEFVDDISKILNVTYGTLSEDGWVKLNDGATEFFYDYDTGLEDYPLSVWVRLFNSNVEHTYVDGYTYKDETDHYTKICSICRTVDEDSVVEHTIKYDFTSDYAESKHKEYCADCDFEIIEDCTYASDCEQWCSECNIGTRMFDLEYHTLEYTRVENSDTGHSFACKNCSFLGGEICIYDFDCTENCVCGRENPNAAAHTVTFVYNEDGTHDKFCSVCEKVFADDATCVYEETVNDAYVASKATCISGTTYYKSCDCGHMSTDTFVSGEPDPANHEWNDTDVCSRCGAVKISKKTFPDDVFRGFILGEFFSSLNEDEIFTSEELSLVKRIYIDVDYISDLSGIEYFTELTTLSCGSIQCLKTVDLSQNTKLTDVYFYLQVWYITIAPDATFDLNTLGIDVSLLTLPEGYTVNDGVIKLEAGVYDVSGLTYPSGYGDVLFNVILTVTNPHTHASVESYNDCTREEVCLCGEITKAATEHIFGDDGVCTECGFANTENGTEGDAQAPDTIPEAPDNSGVENIEENEYQGFFGWFLWLIDFFVGIFNAVSDFFRDLFKF